MRARVVIISAFVAGSALLAGMTPATANQQGREPARAPVALVLRYSFDNDQNGVVRDASPSGLHGALVNADPVTAYGPSVPGRGRALTLVGTRHQYVDVPEADALDVNRFTLAALVRYTGVENDATFGRWEVLEKAGAYWMNVRTNGHIRVGGFFGSCAGGSAWKYLDSTGAIATNRWIHLAATYTGSTLTVWIDGKRSGSRAISGATCSNDEPLAVGAKDAPSKGVLEAFWDGGLDDVRVYNRALAAGEIARLVPAA